VKLKSKTQLFLFPGYCLASERPDDRNWSGMLSGVAVSSRTKRIRRKFLINLLGRLMDASPDELTTELCLQRTAPFFLAPTKLRRIPVSVDGKPTNQTLATKRNGHFQRTIHGEFRGEPRPEMLRVTTGNDGAETDTTLQILDSSGTSVISDIDDTIKFSNVENRAELLANTFLREFVPIEGMSDVYQSLASRDIAFHYVTASPWQLHRPLEQFLAGHQYPRGSMHFRTFRLSDHFLKRLGLIHRRGKSAVVRRILSQCPQRKFILIGDSGEKDAEIYARCFRDHPYAVKRVLIRLVSPDHRYKETIIRARINLPESVFATFSGSEELGNLLDAI
jgi:phosphatidate phosphatase APP1